MLKYLLLIIFSLTGNTQRLAVTVHVPNDAKIGDTVTLECNYDFGNQSLYLVKWYKGLREIYRYVEHDKPNKMVFPQPNITVDEHQSSQTKVVLKNVQPGTADNYTCEVLTEAPWFSAASDSEYLHIKQNQIDKLPFIQVTVPNHVKAGDNAVLLCNYSIDSKTLHSVKWYKDNLEFYRYTPSDTVKTKLFPLPGIDVDVENSTESRLVLKTVGFTTFGKYRCEISSGPPQFSIKYDSRMLNVDTQRLAVTVHVPNDARIGDNVTLECNYDVGNQSLYLVKWYKGLQEIYRYVEHNKPNKMVFPQPDITVDEHQSSQTKVVLENVQPGTADNYTCEVLTEAPWFSEASDSEYLHIKQNEINKIPFIQVSVPNHVKAGDNAVLLCNYSIDSTTLHSVKWYKDNLEFYRYTPSDTVKTKLFPLPGIDVDVENSTESRLVLKTVGFTTFGKYRCEISLGPPQFSLKYDSRMLNVFPIPLPTVIVDNDFVSVGDKIQAVCTVPALDPPVDIIWLLNGNKVNNFSMAKQRKQPHILAPTASFVNVEVVNEMFENNKANLTCVTSRGKFYEAQTTIIIEKDDVKA